MEIKFTAQKQRYKHGLKRTLIYFLLDPCALLSVFQILFEQIPIRLLHH